MTVHQKSAYTLGELAEILGVEYRGDPTIVIRGVGPLEAAEPDRLSFLANAKYASMVPRSRAGAIVVEPSLADTMDRPLLLSERPYLTMARAAQLFHRLPPLNDGVHKTAFVADRVALGPDVRVGPLVHLGSGSRIGARTRVYGSAYIGCGVSVGEDCLIYPGVHILDGCRVGDRVIVHSGTVIGSDGYGFAQDAQGRHVKIPQAGIVQIDDDVEIGANCTIDRATFGKTWIQRGTKIDNLVQLAHNVVVGEHSLLVAQVGIAGSTRLGRHVVLGGQVGVVGHIELGDAVRVGAQSGVAHSVEPGKDLIGSPAVEHRQWFRTHANIQRLPRMKNQIRELQKRVAELEGYLKQLRPQAEEDEVHESND
jgi:UDP-3-O-[3-hydroxymyristoyl] glucosamine N-acyltransferase